MLKVSKIIRIENGDSQEELSLKCAEADPYARKRLYEVYGGQLLAICLRYIGDRDTAHDVFHDGIIKIYQSIGQFKFLGEGSLKAWLSRVMVNEALGYLRKKIKKKTAFADIYI